MLGEEAGGPCCYLHVHLSIQPETLICICDNSAAQWERSFSKYDIYCSITAELMSQHSHCLPMPADVLQAVRLTMASMPTGILAVTGANCTRWGLRSFPTLNVQDLLRAAAMLSSFPLNCSPLIGDWQLQVWLLSNDLDSSYWVAQTPSTFRISEKQSVFFLLSDNTLRI